MNSEYLGIINSSSKNTLILLDNLLAWAKSQTRNIVHKPKKINLTAIVSEIVDSSQSIAKIKNISLKHIQTDLLKNRVEKFGLKVNWEKAVPLYFRYLLVNYESQWGLDYFTIQ